jgi:2-amino-4-hydroxy-6-hydroxymethyldihydropteridine diphosphokinase
MATVYVALGANLGNREANLRMALGGITRMAQVDAVSSLYESAAEGSPQQPDYLNAVCGVQPGRPPLPLLRFLLALEREIGRRRGGVPGEPRPIDLDVLLYDDEALEAPELTLPHPRMLGRNFVMRPLAEIAPDVAHPSWRKTAGEAAEELGEAGLSVLSGQGWDGVATAPQDVRL